MIKRAMNATTTSRGRPLSDRWLFRADHPQYSTHILIRRSFAVVPVLVGPAIPREDREVIAERYARAILILFHPWATAVDICHVNQSWSEALIMLKPMFTSKSNKVISNIQLPHECKRDRDDDLYQLVNKPIVSKPVSTPQSYIDMSIDESEELLALLDASVNADQPLINQNMTQYDGFRGRINCAYNTGLNRIKPEQLLMYIGAYALLMLHFWISFCHALGGAGSCGKSRVIEAISDYMYLQGRLHTLRMLAPSSAAAVDINGLTIQSMLHERRNKSSSGNSQLIQTHMSVVENEWRNIDYCFIDEISMVSCYMLAQLHKITTIAKHTLPTVPFTGINLIFLGDFVQYAPVLARPLYSNLLLPSDTLSNTIAYKPNGKRMVSERDIQCKMGRTLWLQVNKVVFLTQQMRNKDREFMDMQTRLRMGQCNDEIRSNQLPIVIVANDQVRRHGIDNAEIRHFLLCLPDNKTEGLPGYLPIVPNMPVLITHNIATELHISNGSIGRLVKLVYENEEQSCGTSGISNSTFPSNTMYMRKPLYAL
ncbi:unnamed protein product, partial [Didymodactylos carnosus]